MKIKRIISLLLIISMTVLPFFVSSCGEKANTNNNNNNNNENKNAAVDGNDAGESKPEEVVDPKLQYDPKFDSVDMGGYVFKFGTRDDATHKYPAHAFD